MANRLNGHYSDQMDFYKSNDSWFVGAHATMSVTGHGLNGNGSFDNLEITVRGKIWVSLDAIHTGGDHVDIDVRPGALLSGHHGVYVYGNSVRIDNGGDILGFYGIGVSGAQSIVRNTGVIHGYNSGIYLEDASDTLINGRGGEIYAGIYGVYVSGGASGEKSRVTNHGTISGDQFSFFSSDADDTLVNDGQMVGDIAMGAGDDTLDSRGGRLNGMIVLAAGNDTLWTDKASLRLTEQAPDGMDTVKSTVSYTLSAHVERLFLLGNKDIDGKGTSLADRLHGNSGNNDLKGLGGADYLYGHKGNDRLFGGGDADWFYFSTGDGDDKVMDYVDGSDQLHLEGWNAITSLADLKNNHATNQGANLLIEAGGDSLLVLGINKSDLNVGDVFF